MAILKDGQEHVIYQKRFESAGFPDGVIQCFPQDLHIEKIPYQYDLRMPATDGQGQKREGGRGLPRAFYEMGKDMGFHVVHLNQWNL